MKKIEAKIKGQCEQDGQFELEATFELIEPDEGELYYGTGCYMVVKIEKQKHLIDVRYAGTKNLVKLARNWINSYFGKNLKEIKFSTEDLQELLSKNSKHR